MTALDRVKEAIRGELGRYASRTQVDRLASVIAEIIKDEVREAEGNLADEMGYDEDRRNYSD